MALDEVAIVGVVVHRHQLDCGDPEIQQVTDRLVRAEACIRPTHRFGQPGMPPGKALHVQFVDHRFVPGRAGPAIVAPRERRVDHGGEHRERGVVAAVEREILFRIAEAIPVDLVAPADVAADRLRIRLEHDLVRIEPESARGIVGTVNPVAVELSRQDPGHVSVPDEVGLLRQRDSCRLSGAVRGIEQAEFHLERMLGEDREVDAGSVPCRAERIRGTRPDFHAGPAMAQSMCDVTVVGIGMRSGIGSILTSHPGSLSLCAGLTN